MGTSMSSLGTNGTDPLVPPWAEQGDTIVISGPDGQETEIDNAIVQQEIPAPQAVELVSTRFAAARRAFGEYARSGSRDDLKKSLGHYARKSSGKGNGVAKRLASGITAGTALQGLLTGNTVSTTNGEINLQVLQGLSTDQAIDKISQVLTPNSGDADIIRSALNYSLSEALEDCEQFNDVTIDSDLLGQVFTYYITDLVFQQVVIDMGKAWNHAQTPLRQLEMEYQLRELIKVIVDSKLDKAFSNSDLTTINSYQIRTIQIACIQATVDEWELY